MGAASNYRRSVQAQFGPPPGAAFELLDYVPGTPRTFPGLPNAQAITVFLVATSNSASANSESIFTIGSSSSFPTSLVAFGGSEGGLRFGLNTYTGVNDTADTDVFSDTRLCLVEATIYNNDPSRFSLLVNGVPVPHSIKPAGGVMTNRDFGGDIGLGYLLLSRPEFNWGGRLYAWGWGYDMPAAPRVQMRRFVHAKFPEIIF